MVHDKAKSGDPDYDDKVPMRDQLGETVTTADGTVARLTEANGPIGPDGAHINIEPLNSGVEVQEDNRPAPGGVATEASGVQVATPPAESQAAQAKASAPVKAAPKNTSTK